MNRFHTQPVVFAGLVFFLLSGCSPDQPKQQTTDSDSTPRPTRRPHTVARQSFKGAEPAGDPASAEQSAGYQPQRISITVPEGDEQAFQTKLLELADELGRRPELIHDLLLSLSEETNPVAIRRLSQVISTTEAALPEDPRVAASALNLIQNNRSTEVRQAVLALLGKVPSATDDTLQAVALLSKQDTDNSVRSSAINAMGAWMGRDPANKAQIAEAVLNALCASKDEGVRGDAIRQLALQTTRLPENFRNTLAQVMMTDPSPANRAAAAQAMNVADGEPRGPVLTHLQSAFQSESDPGTKKAILFQIVRTSEPGSTDALQRIAGGQGGLAQDVHDYIEIIQSGKSDPDEIQAAKQKLEADRSRPFEPAPSEP